jgi:capping protein alpha
MGKDFSSVKLRATSARAIVDHIQSNETNYQDGLEDMYTEVSEKLLKGMRRIMPITRQKFDWSRPNLL